MPDGVIGIVGGSSPLTFRYPTNPFLDTWDRLRTLQRAHNTGRPSEMLQSRTLLREAGFSRTEASGTLATRSRWPRWLARRDAKRRAERSDPAARRAWKARARRGLCHEPRAGADRPRPHRLGRGARRVLRATNIHGDRLGVIWELPADPERADIAPNCCIGKIPPESVR